MILIDDKLVSDELFEEQFVCDLNACKGACCIEGEAGAPVLSEEVALMKASYKKVASYLSEEGKTVIRRQGIVFKDEWGEYETPLLGDAGACAYVVMRDGVSMCGIELAWKDQKIKFRKPVSCQLYPIRVSKIGDFDVLNYHKWSICSAACAQGQKLKMPVYKFLKEAIVRKFGNEFYQKLVEIGQQYNPQKD